MKQERFIVRSRAVFTGPYRPTGPGCHSGGGAENQSAAVLDCGGEYGDWGIRDYGDRMIMPSFIDAHTHLFSGAVNDSAFVCSDLGACRSQEECVEMIRASRMPILSWSAFGEPDGFGKLETRRSRTNGFLDEAVGGRPVYLQCADAHSMWLNTKALREAKIDPDLQLSDGIICKFDDGELSGLLLEPSACAPAVEKYMDFTDAELLEIHRNFQKKLATPRYRSGQ